jgi:hypothetical protein
MGNNKYHCKPEPKTKGLTDRQIRALILMYNDPYMYSIGAIRERFGLGTSEILRYIDKAGIPRRKSNVGRAYFGE